MSDKQYTPKEAALAVLKKAEELYKSSKLAKAEIHIHEAPSSKVQASPAPSASAHVDAPAVGGANKAAVPASGKDADQHAQGKGPKGEIKPNEKEQAPPDGTQAGDKPSNSLEERNGNPGPGAEPTNYGEDYKGHLKLAQWMGRMSHKRSKKEAQ